MRHRWSAFLAVMVVWLVATAPSAAVDLVFKDHQYSFQALRALAAAPGGGSDVGEVLLVLGKVTEGDDESWYTEWKAMADRRVATAENALAAGHERTAATEYLRASNYYRCAEFFMRGQPPDPRALETYRKSRACFQKVAELSGGRIRAVEIPFESTTLPGYLCTAEGGRHPRPLILVQTGFDGTAEELYHSFAVMAVARGYDCLLFEGPGQGRVIREQKLPFRPNWETVVTPVVDFALAQPHVDRARIALYGISMGGYFAPRAAAFEHRLAALVANGGIWDVHSTRIDEKLDAQLDDPEAAAAIDQWILNQMKTSPATRWLFDHAMMTFGATSPSAWMRMTRPYTMKGLAGKITCPTLIIDSEGDKDVPGQAKQLFDALTCPKQFLLFTAADGAEEHCQMGASVLSASRILDWLDETLAVTRGPKGQRRP